MRKHRLFERIAFAYQWFFNWQVEGYQKVIEANKTHLGINRGDSILDLGCGTAAFSYALKNQGYRVKGVDNARAMVEKGRANGIDCITGDVIYGLPFPDNSFDLVVAAFVIHGLEVSARKGFYHEASRLTGGRIIFYDYNQKQRTFINIIELLEGGNYFSFLRDGLAEMRDVFTDVEILPAGDWASWYICYP